MEKVSKRKWEQNKRRSIMRGEFYIVSRYYKSRGCVLGGGGIKMEEEEGEEKKRLRWPPFGGCRSAGKPVWNSFGDHPLLESCMFSLH